MIAGEGDDLPVSAMPVDGTFPTGTAQWEKRNIALEIPGVGRAALHPVRQVRPGLPARRDPRQGLRRQRPRTARPTTFKAVAGALEGLQGPEVHAAGRAGGLHRLRALRRGLPGQEQERSRSTRPSTWSPQPPLREARSRELGLLPDDSRDRPQAALSLGQVKDVQLLQPLFEFSGACAGCGETPYIKLMTQLFGDRVLIANATGCSSIYGGNLPTTPYCTQRRRARAGLVQLAVRRQRRVRPWACASPSTSRTSTPANWSGGLASRSATSWRRRILDADQTTEAGHRRAARARRRCSRRSSPASTRPKRATCSAVADALVKKSVWIVGGDGWAYDIGYGGLDHVLASGRNVNILVLDTEVYSNTGGQMSKSTPRGAVAKFAAGGKPRRQERPGADGDELRQRLRGARRDGRAATCTHVKAFLEAEAYDGPSLIIAYSHCIAHGYDLAHGTGSAEGRGATPATGRCSATTPTLAAQGKNPFQLDSKRADAFRSKKYIYNETRYTMLAQSNPEEAKQLLMLGAGRCGARAGSSTNTWRPCPPMATPKLPTRKQNLNRQRRKEPATN